MTCTQTGVADDEDRQLVRLALAGDAGSFDTLVERHCRKVASVAGRLLDHPSEVEDAVQETFVKAFENLRSFRGEASVRTWLIRIALNVARSRRRGFWLRRVSLTHDLDVLYPEGERQVETLAHSALLQQQCRAALERLPDRLRLPFTLRFFEHLSGGEFAVVLGWNERTVWTRIYTASRKLREQLAPALEEG